MASLLIGLGNALRHDDGAAHAVLNALAADSRELPQLTPEVAADLARYDQVVFVDADAQASELLIEPLDEKASPLPLTHLSTPQQVVALSRALFGFRGHAFLCRIPAYDFSFGEGLTGKTSRFAEEAAHKLAALVHARR